MRFSKLERLFRHRFDYFTVVSWDGERGVFRPASAVDILMHGLPVAAFAALMGIEHSYGLCIARVPRNVLKLKEYCDTVQEVVR